MATGMRPHMVTAKITATKPISLLCCAGVLFLAVVVLSGIRVAQEYQRAVVFRLGRFTSIRGPGLYYLLPLIEWQSKVDMRTVTVEGFSRGSVRVLDVTEAANVQEVVGRIRAQGGGYAGTLLMGLTFALTSFACIGPIVGPLLVASVRCCQ